MAEEKKSNTLTIVIAVMAALSIALVLTLKADEVKHLELKGANTTLESNAAALHDVKRFKNVAVE
ncbi:MAG: hypothetical protein KAI44_00435 [Methylococcales bacterium]|nr:hypothetical protein [Methylococcales bacterium]MCK5477360.1 hypothetical protein [Methylococcales bacterium]